MKARTKVRAMVRVRMRSQETHNRSRRKPIAETAKTHNRSRKKPTVEAARNRNTSQNTNTNIKK